MKTHKLLFLKKNILGTIIVSWMIFSISSCSESSKFVTSSVVPAARGAVSIKKDKNNNYIIKVSLSYLAEADRLTPSKKSYVVWLEAENSVVINIGPMKSAIDNFSNRLEARFQTISTLKPIKIFITAEDDPNVKIPDSTVIISTSNF